MLGSAAKVFLFESSFRFGGSQLLYTGSQFKTQLRQTCRDWVDGTLGASPQPPSLITAVSLARHVDDYADHICVDAFGDLGKFLKLPTLHLTPGGLPVASLLISYPRKGVQPNWMSLSALSEGIAGWYLRTKGYHSVCRPLGEGLDLVFQRSDGRWCLISVKCSFTKERLKTAMVEATATLLKEIVSARHGMRRFLAYIIGVRFIDSLAFEVYSLELEEQ